MAIPVSYNLKHLWARRTTTLLTVLGIGLVVWIFVMVMSVARGLQQSMLNTGEPDNVLIMSQDAQFEFSSAIQPSDVQLLRTYDGFKRDASGRPLLSVETVFGSQQPRGTDPPFLFVRGIDAEVGFQVHSVLSLKSGRLFRPLSREIIVGRHTAEKYPATLGLGCSVKIGRMAWEVVGVFEAKGTALESVLFADRMDLKTHLNMQRDFVVLAKMENPEAQRRFIAQLKDDKRASLKAQREKDYYAEQARTSKQMEALAYLVSIVMGLGAVFGAVNTMYAAVAGRAREIGTLRALGFTRQSVRRAFLVEGVIIAVLGGLVGAGLGALGSGLSFELPEQGVGLVKISALPTWQLLAGSMGFALIMGLIGGWFPAGAASRLDIVRALRKA